MDIYAAYSMQEATDGFDGQPRYWCDRQFSVLSDAVLCFITLGRGTEESYLSSPSDVVWKPSRIEDTPSGKYSWLPRAVREVYDHSASRQIRRHHVFVRTFDMASFLYVGEAHLGSYGTSTAGGVVSREACFSLNQKLPRDLWLRFGGYSGWRIEANHKRHIVDFGDLHSLDRLLGQFDTETYSHLCMTRYEEDSLTIFTNADCAWLMYLREPEDSGLYVDNPARGEETAEFECSCGISLEYPASSTVSLMDAAEIARQFFESGELPDDIEWIGA